MTEKGYIAWKRVGSGDDIEYVATRNGVRIGSAYRGGNRWYPWSWTVDFKTANGRGSGTSETLGAAKDAVEAARPAPTPEESAAEAQRRAEFEERWQAAKEERVVLVKQHVAEALQSLPLGPGDNKVIEPETYPRHGEEVTQPLDPDVYGWGWLYAEQYDGNHLVAIHYDDLNAGEYIEVSGIDYMSGDRPHGFYRSTVRLPLPRLLRPTEREREDAEVSITGGGPRDARRVAIAARVLTIAAHLAEQIEEQMR